MCCQAERARRQGGRAAQGRAARGRAAQAAHGAVATSAQRRLLARALHARRIAPGPEQQQAARVRKVRKALGQLAAARPVARAAWFAVIHRRATTTRFSTWRRVRPTLRCVRRITHSQRSGTRIATTTSVPSACSSWSTARIRCLGTCTRAGNTTVASTWTASSRGRSNAPRTGLSSFVAVGSRLVLDAERSGLIGRFV